MNLQDERCRALLKAVNIFAKLIILNVCYTSNKFMYRKRKILFEKYVKKSAVFVDLLTFTKKKFLR